MAHSNNDLRYRVVLLSESGSPPETSSPVAHGEPSASPAPENVFAYTVVPVEETFSPPTPASAEPVYQVLPVADTAPAYRQRYDHRELIRRRRRQRLPWTLERHGLESLGYLFREPRILGWLIGGLGLGTAIGSTLFLLLTSNEPESMVFLLLWMGFPIYVLCFVGGFLDGVLASATQGEAGVVRWPGFNVALILRGCWRCLWCFLAGPIVPLAAGAYFWLHAGDLATVDWWIMAELVFVSSTYWLFSFLAVVQNDSIWQATPANVLKVIRQLGWHAALAAVLMFAWTVIHGLWALDALRELHRFIGTGWFWLWLCSIFAVYWMTCLLRWLGVRSYRCRIKDAPPVIARVLWTPQLPPASI